MSYEIYWHVEKRILMKHYYGDVVPEDIAQATSEALDYVCAGRPPIFMIINMLNIRSWPTDFKYMLKHVEKFQSDPRIAWMLLLSDNSLVNFFGVLTAKVTRIPLRDFKTLDEIEEFISYRDVELADLFLKQ